MPHYGDSGGKDAVDALDDFTTALQLDGVRTRFLHYADGGVQCLLGVSLICAE